MDYTLATSFVANGLGTNCCHVAPVLPKPSCYSFYRWCAAKSVDSEGLSFTPDGKAVAYPVRGNGVDNLLVQPLSGSSAGRQITAFDSEQIRSFRWSPDGSSLAILRGHSESDVVLLRESKP